MKFITYIKRNSEDIEEKCCTNLIEFLKNEGYSSVDPDQKSNFDDSDLITVTIEWK
ncbi:MAG TPA: hypothetical protein HA355_02120 [Methanosphaera sp.]|jgi:hypothetical protein|nr:hypothetical protein [Methanosphaera sp.]